jgi:D-lactate dehydrogenase
MVKVVVFDTKPYDKESLLREKQINWQFFEFRLNETTAKMASGYSTICVFVNDHVDAATLSILKELNVKLIVLRCAGYNNVDVESAKKIGIKVTRVPNYSPYSVAEHTIALLLALNRKIYRSYNRVRDLNFSLNGLLGFDVRGKTVGIIGTGRIGKIVAQILKGFEADVITYDAKPDHAWAEKSGIKYVPFLELLNKSDIVSLHVPLLPETLYMINEKTIAQMKPGAYIINTSRGKIIETAALIEALKSGKLGGVALDTYEEEEGIFFEDLSNKILLDDELARLLTFPNVLITAHQAFFTAEALNEIAKTTAENILRFEANEPFLPQTSLF